MPLPGTGNYVHAIIGGAVTTVGDQWQAGIWWNEATTATDLNAAATAYLTETMTAFWNAASTPWKARQSDGTSLDYVKLYEYVAGVLNAEGSATQSPSLGTNSGGASPAYSACCVSLLTSKFGRSYRGRMYLPFTAPVAHATCQFPSLTGEIANFKTWIDYFSANVLTGMTSTLSPQVISRKHGTAQQITKFRIDSQPDTQHGRSRKANPTFSVTTTL